MKYCENDDCEFAKQIRFQEPHGWIACDNCQPGCQWEWWCTYHDMLISEVENCNYPED